MAAKRRYHNPVPVSDLVSGILDPVLAKRAGISSSLLQCWEEIVGEKLGCQSRPQKVRWARRASDDDPFEPATLVVACEAAAALHIQHQTGEIMARVNGFLGYQAIGRIMITQKPVLREPNVKPKPRQLSVAEKHKLDETVSGVDDDELRAALARLGASVVGSRGGR